MSETTVNSKGQLTIPADIRTTLGLTAGDRVVFTLLPDGTTVMRAKKRSMASLKGLLKMKRGKKKVSITDMKFGSA